MNDDERLLDLLTEKLERRLTPAELAELDRLLAANPAWRRHDLAYAAAAIQLALEPGEDMPDDVKARVFGRVLGDALPTGSVVPMPVADRVAGGPPRVVDVTQPLREAKVIRGPWSARAPWLAAAAAAIVAVVGWSRALPDGGDPDEGPPRIASLEEVARAQDAVVVAWAQTEDPLGKTVRGDVVWSPSKQQGYMRFQGLAANDPTKAQYQLWIFDAERDERFPVDGGVFDVPADANGDVLVPIDPRVPVGKVTLFAVTLEKPGGVVVSTRERLVALGKVS